jgi:hypothetical protein
VVTAVTWGPEPRARILFADGSDDEVGIERLADFVTERGNPGNHLGVARAVVRFPSDDLRDGIFLVDTPGVGSIYERNDEETRRFLPDSDAAIFVTSADPPVSPSELRFIREIRAQVGHIMFVLNKVDLPERQRSRRSDRVREGGDRRIPRTGHRPVRDAHAGPCPASSSATPPSRRPRASRHSRATYASS